jgi:hypothetical protein
MKQFPAGLPFGLSKPRFQAVPEQGSQSLSFVETKGNYIIKENVYPDFTLSNLAELVDPPILILRAVILPGMCKDGPEKKFFSAYMEKYYRSLGNNVPILIPQAWIQWHTQTKGGLRAQGSSYADDPHRVDFVAFWNNRRFVILVDDISHYATKKGDSWFADQELYSKRLKEDRKLNREGCQVFRVSNWEMRQSEESISEILNDLQTYIGF